MTAAPRSISMPPPELDTMPLGWRHWRIWAVSASGQFLGGAIATLVGIILPLLHLRSEPTPSTLELALTGAVELVGLMAGSLVIGHLTDRFGRLLFFRLGPVLMIAAGLSAALSPNIGVLIVSLFLVGVGIGGEYALDAAYISETMPARWRILMVGAAKATSAVGNAAGALAGCVLILYYPEPQVWRAMLLFIPLAALLMLLARLPFAESPRWLLEKGKNRQASAALHKLLGPHVAVGEQTCNAVTGGERAPSIMDLFRPGCRKQTILAGVPWACEGIGVYGIGIFTPVIMLILGAGVQGDAPLSSFWDNQLGAINATLFVNIFLIVGFLTGLAVMRKITHLEMQFFGFVLSAAGMAVLAQGHMAGADPLVLMSGFIVFNLFLNAGPNLTTFILPVEIYPVRWRGTGYGFAAAMGQTGSVLGAFSFPFILKAWGLSTALWLVVLAQLAGALVTGIFGRALNRQEAAEKAEQEKMDAAR